MKTEITIESPFADLRDIASFHWRYDGSSRWSQEALTISAPGKRISIQLDSQIKRVTEQHAELLAALNSVLEDAIVTWTTEGGSTRIFEQLPSTKAARAAIAKAEHVYYS
jgi:hypothetical protein